MAQTNADLIWKIADLLRGPYQPNQYGDVILPFTILRRLECILELTKDQVLAEYKKVQSQKIDPGVVLKSTFKLPRGWWCWPPQRPKHEVHGGRAVCVPRSIADDGLGPDPGRIADIERRVWRWRRWLWWHRNYE